jgi:hypothetical protein
MARHMHVFMGQLSDDQRERLIEMIEDRRFRRAFFSGRRHGGER